MKASYIYGNHILITTKDGLQDGTKRNEVNSIVIQKFAKCLQTTLQVHDQAQFGFLLCKIFRGSQGTIFEETKNIQILKCNLREDELHFPVNTDYGLFCSASLHNQKRNKTHVHKEKIRRVKPFLAKTAVKKWMHPFPCLQILSASITQA